MLLLCFQHPEFSFLLKERVCPLIIKLFSPSIKHRISSSPLDKPLYPVAVRLLRIVSVLIEKFYTLLVRLCDSGLYLVTNSTRDPEMAHVIQIMLVQFAFTCKFTTSFLLCNTLFSSIILFYYLISTIILFHTIIAMLTGMGMGAGL